MRWFQRKVRYGPTPAARLLLLAAAVGLAWLGVLRIYPFLAVDRPVGGDWLVVEGWVPDHTLQALMELHATGAYRDVIAAGGPIEYGAALHEHETLAQVTAARLVSLGLPPEHVHAVPAPFSGKDRTLTAARAVRTFLEEQGEMNPALDVLTSGPHARRSLLLYRQALGARANVGVIAVTPAAFDHATWWQSSAGFRSVIGEALAWLYARCRPHAENEKAISAP